MLKVFKKELNFSLISSIIYIILGIVIISNPEETLSIVGKTVAILSIVYGSITTIINIVNIKQESSLLFGIFTIVMGIALLIYPNTLSILLSLGLGIWFIASSVTRLKFAVFLKDVREMNWLIVLAGSLITLIIGISFIFTPLASAVTLTTVSGIMMIVYSLIDIFEIIFIKRNIKAIEKVLQ
mgnify:CR=1 FL=1